MEYRKHLNVVYERSQRHPPPRLVGFLPRTLAPPTPANKRPLVRVRVSTRPNYFFLTHKTLADRRKSPSAFSRLTTNQRSFRVSNQKTNLVRPTPSVVSLAVDSLSSLPAGARRGTPIHIFVHRRRRISRRWQHRGTSSSLRPSQAAQSRPAHRPGNDRISPKARRDHLPGHDRKRRVCFQSSRRRLHYAKY